MKKFFSLSLMIVLAVGILLCPIGDTAEAEEVDLVSAASITANEASFEKAIGRDGTWIVAPTADLHFNSELVIEGKFHDKGKSSNKVYRKIAPYEQDDNYNITKRYTITAPQFTVKSPNTKFQGGHFVGDVYVQAEDFTIDDAVVVGDVYFAKERYKSSFNKNSGAKVTGDMKVKDSNVDIVSAASITGNAASFKKALDENGSWLVAATNDLVYNSELVVEGEFTKEGKVVRELALYASDENHNLTERFTVVTPQFTVKSPNTIFKGGYFVGDVYVQSKGFTINDAEVIGNIYFEKEAYKASFSVKNGGKVTGMTKVQ